jgi:hypothetical protein
LLTATDHNAFFLWEFSKLSESAEQSLILSNRNVQIHSIFYCLFPELSSVDETLHLRKDLVNSVRKNVSGPVCPTERIEAQASIAGKKGK